MFSVFQELDAATNLWDKGKNFYDKKCMYHRYKSFPYFFRNYKKKTYITRDGDGVVFMSCEVVVLDKANTKYIKAKLDISDAKKDANFPPFYYMSRPNKTPFKDFYFDVWSDKDVITDVKEDYSFLPEKDKSKWRKSSKHIALKINLDSNKLEEKQIYLISYMFSVPGMFAIKDGYYSFSESSDGLFEEMVSSLDIEEYCENCKYSVYMDKDVKISGMVSAFLNKSGVDEPISIGAKHDSFGFYGKNTMTISKARKYRSVGFTWKMCENPNEQNGGVEDGEIVPVLTNI